LWNNNWRDGLWSWVLLIQRKNLCFGGAGQGREGGPKSEGSLVELLCWSLLLLLLLFGAGGGGGRGE